MKKIFYILVIAVMFAFTSCYDDYVKDNDYNAVYFAYQTTVRTVVVGEGMQFRQGITLAGVIDNKQNREVHFKVDNALVNSSTLSALKNHAFAYIKELAKPMTSVEPLAEDLYSLEYNNKPADKIMIKKGDHTGFITVKVDSAKFLASIDRTSPYGMLPLTITKADVDLIYDGKESTAIGVRYDNMFFGNYWHGGETVVKDSQGQEVEVIKYHTTIPQPDSRVWTLTTVAPFELTANAVGEELSGTKAQLKLIQGENGAITVDAVPGADYVVEPDGACAFNKAKLLQDRKIFLKYKYEKDGLTYHATDTLTFRNRERDGVNEWQDENPDNYKK